MIKICKFLVKTDNFCRNWIQIRNISLVQLNFDSLEEKIDILHRRYILNTPTGKRLQKWITRLNWVNKSPQNR